MSNALDKLSERLAKLKVSNTTFRSSYSDRVSKLEVTSGYSINELIDLFAAGYTLRAPDYTEQMADLGEIVDKLNAVGMVNACSAEDIRAACSAIDDPAGHSYEIYEYLMKMGDAKEVEE